MQRACTLDRGPAMRQRSSGSSAGRFRRDGGSKYIARQVIHIMMTKAPIALMALASSVALAQQVPGDGPGSGNIPAPDLFDHQLACTSNLPSARPTPTVAATGAEQSALDRVIGMGTLPILDPTVVNDLGYVIPSMGSNCGMGLGTTSFTAAVQGAIATDVAEGYSALWPKFIAAYGDPGIESSTGTAGAVVLAQAALARAQADSTTSEAVLNSLRNTLEDAQEKHNTAQAAFNAIAQGPIYQAAAAEWMAKARVEQSITAYNEAVNQTNSAQATLDSMTYSAYVPLGNNELTTTLVIISNGMGTVNLGQLNNYTNGILGNPQVATVADNGVTTTVDSNFDATGKLVIPMRLTDGTLESITSSTRVDVARRNRDNHRIALAALKKFQDENQNVLFTTLLAEAVRRAQIETDYYEQQFNNALADNTNQNPLTVDLPSTPVDETAPYSIASRHADYLAATNGRASAEAALRSAAADREAATQNVVDQFQDPESFLAQLVARRELLKSEADEAVADARNPSMALTDAAAAAAKALEEAQDAHTRYTAVIGDPEGPIDDLVAALLEEDGDDGQALVDALSQTYGATRENLESIEALTADTEDGAEEDGPITANRKARETNAGDIEALDGRVTQNEQDIETLKSDTEEMTGMIATNAGNISANASNIATNAGNIVTNASFISQNAANIAHNSARIDVNTYNIAQNSGRIDANAAAIGMNSNMILDNRNLIGELTGQVDMMRAGVAASIAISRMPSIDGGLSFGAGVYGGETALAVGFALDHKRTTFDFGVTSSGGEVGAGIGVGVKIWGD